jgi:SOS response regulatory protein OraA/RecX
VAKKATDAQKKALNYAYLLLRFRKRGSRELRLRLEIKGFGVKEIDETVSFLEEKGFIEREKHSQAQEAAELAQAKFAKLKNISPEKLRSRVYAYLTRRWFSADVITETIEKIL